jgi:hypothetical protein
MTLARGDAALPASTLVAAGELHSGDVSKVYDAAMSAAWSGNQTVVLDLSRVTGWSTPAQAMVLGVAQELALRRSSLVLVGASLGLRLQSRQLDVFTRVRQFADQVGRP